MLLIGEMGTIIGETINNALTIFKGTILSDLETLQKLQLRYIAPDEVKLSPKLLK